MDNETQTNTQKPNEKKTNLPLLSGIPGVFLAIEAIISAITLLPSILRDSSNSIGIGHYYIAFFCIVYSMGLFVSCTKRIVKNGEMILFLPIVLTGFPAYFYATYAYWSEAIRAYCKTSSAPSFLPKIICHEIENPMLYLHLALLAIGVISLFAIFLFIFIRQNRKNKKAAN